jgi:nucleoid DNA-binding protein
MNKTDLVRRLVPRMRKQKYTEDTVGLFVDLLLEEVRDALLRGEAVTLRQLGSFELVARKGRVGRVLAKGGKVGAPVAIPPRVVVRFTAGKWAKDVLLHGPGSEASGEGTKETAGGRP